MITSSLITIGIAVALIFTGILMLAYVVRGVPKSTVIGPAQGDVVLVATKTKKKSKGDA